MTIDPIDERRTSNRRADDALRAWLPMLVYMVVTLVTMGVIWGKTSGRLDLIEWRLQQIEHHIP